MPVFRPGKPRVRLQLSADTVLPASPAVQQVPWDVTDWQDGEITIDGAGGVVIGRAGLYLVTACIGRLAGTTNSAMQLQLRQGTLPFALVQTPPTTALISTAASAIDELDVGAVISVATQIGSGTRTLQRIGSHLAVTRVGPVSWN